MPPAPSPECVGTPSVSHSLYSRSTLLCSLWLLHLVVRGTRGTPPSSSSHFFSDLSSLLTSPHRLVQIKTTPPPLATFPYRTNPPPLSPLPQIWAASSGFLHHVVSITLATICVQVLMHQPTSSPLHLLCRRFGSEPPTDSKDVGLLPASDSFINIFGSPVLSHYDAALNHLKPTLDETLPHRPHAFVTPLEASNDDLPSGEVHVFECSRDLDVIGSVLRGLFVSFLL